MKELDVLFVIVFACSQGKALVSAQLPTNTSSGFYVRSYYSAPDCSLQSSNNFLAYISGACVQNENNGSLIFSCTNPQAPRIISYTSTDCSGQGLTHVAPVAACTAAEKLFFTVSCVTDLSTLFYGPGIGNIAFKNASQCEVVRSPVSLSVSTLTSQCIPMVDKTTGYLSYTISCNNTSQKSLYCRDDICRDCDVYASADLNQTCASTNSKEICVLGGPRPPPPPPSESKAPVSEPIDPISPASQPMPPPFSAPLRANIPTPSASSAAVTAVGGILPLVITGACLLKRW